MTGEGIVIKTSGNIATVKIKRASACGHDCGECNLCKNPDIETDILNLIGAKTGDRVKLGTNTRKVLLYAFIIYMLPIIGAFAVYAAASACRASGMAVIICEIVWFLVWFGFVLHFSKHKVTMSYALEILD